MIPNLQKISKKKMMMITNLGLMSKSRINESDGLEHGEGWNANLQEEGRWISDEQNRELDTASPAAKQSSSLGCLLYTSDAADE